MLICNDTIEVLKNYAEINQSLLFNQGSTLKTVNEQTNVMSKCTVNEAFPQDFAIYDLNKFLGVLSLFVEPELTFSDTSMTIKSSVDANNFVAGDQIAEYQFANKSLFEDEQKILAKEIELPSVEAEFSLEEKYLQQIMRAASVMGLPEVAVEASQGSDINMKAIDSKTSVDSFSVTVGQGSASSFRMIFKIENLKLMRGSYDIQISNKGLGHFSHTTKELEYWIATETTT
tara:strand:+ start:1178 stop:1870 length:693 start_codon:yes stop_codon:yes gene_type:complete